MRCPCPIWSILRPIYNLYIPSRPYPRLIRTKENSLLKLTVPLLLLTLTSGLAQAQTASSTTKPAAKSTTSIHHTATATHHSTAATHHSTTAATPEEEALPANIPAVHGVKQSLYALRYIDISIGNGPLAENSILGTSQADSKIKWYTVHYTGYLAKDGTKFDSSVDRGTPITFPYGVQKVIPGWDTGFEGMHVGGKRRLFVPYQLAYGANGRPPVIPAKADLIFDVELVGISDTPPAPPKPPTPPAAATKPAATAPESKDAKPAAPATPAPAPKPAAPATPAKPETK